MDMQIYLQPDHSWLVFLEKKIITKMAFYKNEMFILTINRRTLLAVSVSSR